MKFKTLLFDEIAVKRAMTRLSYEIIERSQDLNGVVLIGIKTRGVPLAKIIKGNILLNAGVDVPLYELDITHYRDDVREGSKGKNRTRAASRRGKRRDTRRRRSVYRQNDARRDRRRVFGRQGEQHPPCGTYRPRAQRVAYPRRFRRKERPVFDERKNSRSSDRDRRRNFGKHLRKRLKARRAFSFCLK